MSQNSIIQYKEKLCVHLPGCINESGQGRELFYSNCDTLLTCGNKHVDKHRYAFLGTLRHCYSAVRTILLLLLTCLVSF